MMHTTTMRCNSLLFAAVACHPTVPPCRYGIPVVPAYNMSVPLHDAHNGKVMAPLGDIDCIHYCHPGVPEVRGSNRNGSTCISFKVAGVCYN
jgi:hypothetical protein